MYITPYKTQVALLLAATFWLCQCSEVVNETLPTATVTETKEVSKPQHVAIETASRFIDNKQWQQSEAILAQAKELTAAELDEKHLLLAQIEQARGQHHASSSYLAAIKDPKQLSKPHKALYHELLALSYKAQGKTIEALSERIILDSLVYKQANQHELWLLLTSIPDAQLTSLIDQNKDLFSQGWLALQLISRQNRTSPSALLEALNQWQAHYPNHPANHRLPNPLNSIANKLIAQPKQIALLLPLSGPLSGPGLAIQEGILAANKEQIAQTSTTIKSYDTNQSDIATLYQNAIDQGADYVIGPLTKAEVAKVAALEHPVPTLLLNDTETPLGENAYLFGLSPINEATEVAIQAGIKGFSQALVIAPKNDWGQEITKAFTKQWSAQGGQVINTFSYESKGDINQGMKDFLQITESEARQKRVKQTVGQHLQTTISPRQDFDVIVLIAYPSMARQIMPLLTYYNAGDTPIYATSSVYSGHANALKDKDLDGILFCDIPWVFSHQMQAKNWPEQFNSYNRLYALGKDSYALATTLNQLLLFPADGSMNTNGILYLKPSQQVARVLEWGQFKQGLVHSLGRLS